MKTFTTFDRPAGWASLSHAFQDDFAAGDRVQQAPWGGLAILGHAELLMLARNPHADGMAPAAEAMAETPQIHDLLVRSVFTKSGAAHRTDRAALIAAMNAVDIPARCAAWWPGRGDQARAGPETGLPRRLCAMSGQRSSAMMRMRRSAGTGGARWAMCHRRRTCRADVAEAAAAERGAVAGGAGTGAPFSAALVEGVGKAAAADRSRACI